MKTKLGFSLRQIAGTWVIVPFGKEQADYKAVLMPTDSGVLLWNQLEKGCDLQTLVDALTAEYDVGPEQARADAEEFVEKLRQLGCLED